MSERAAVWRGGFAAANGLRLAWEEIGDPHGAPLLLIMGLANQAISWPEAFCQDLAAHGFRVIRFDNRDIGLSDTANAGVRFNLTLDMLRVRAGARVRANYTLHDMVADTVGLMDALEIASAHLVGVSMGGLIGQILSARHPRRVASLTSIMSHTCHPWHSIPRLRLMWMMKAAGRGGHSRETVIGRQIAIYRAIGSPAYPRSEADMLEAFGRAFDRSYRPGGILRQTHAIVATPCFEDLLTAIAAPTQIIHGTEDLLVPVVNGVRCGSLIRGARVELIGGMGHDLPAPLHPRLARLIVDNAARA